MQRPENLVPSRIIAPKCTAMTDPGWIKQLPVIGDLPLGEYQAKLLEIREHAGASSKVAPAEAEPVTPAEAEPVTPAEAGRAMSRARARGRFGRDSAWMYTAHTIGYLPPVDGSDSELMPVRDAALIVADEGLRDARISVSFDELRVADYPGRGPHRILLDFAGRSETSHGSEQLHFITVCEAVEGEQTPIMRRSIFTGLQVGAEGLSLQCATIKVLNECDEALLGILSGESFVGGLQLLATDQPILGQFSALAVGLTEAIARRNSNVVVQAVDFGLDFSAIPLRPRLAEGSYIAMQIPETLKIVWNWRDWVYDPQGGSIVSAQQPDLLIPYNYIIVSVNRDPDA